MDEVVVRLWKARINDRGQSVQHDDFLQRESDQHQREGYGLRPAYSERKSMGTGLRMAWLTLVALLKRRAAGLLPRPVATQSAGKP